MNQQDFIKWLCEATPNLDAAEAAAVLKALQNADDATQVKIIHLITSK
jgi:hypothetical protein